MFEVEEVVFISADPGDVGDVFDAAADPQNQLEWDAGNVKRVEKLTPEPLGRGSRYQTRLTQSIVATPKRFGKLITPVMKPMIRKRIGTINADLESHFERPPSG